MDEQYQLSLFLVTNNSGTTAGAAQITTSNEWKFALYIHFRDPDRPIVHTVGGWVRATKQFGRRKQCVSSFPLTIYLALISAVLFR